MSCSDMIIRAEKPSDLAAIIHLHDQAFGPGRFARTAYRIREGRKPAAGLSLVAVDGARLVGSVRFDLVLVGGQPGALLLGPLVVSPDYAGHRCGLRLMKKGLELAGQAGFSLVLLVGDFAYYQKAGFVQVPPGQIRMPGPVDLSRLLAYELQEGSLGKYGGIITAS